VPTRRGQPAEGIPANPSRCSRPSIHRLRSVWYGSPLADINDDIRRAWTDTGANGEPASITGRHWHERLRVWLDGQAAVSANNIHEVELPGTQDVELQPASCTPSAVEFHEW